MKHSGLCPKCGGKEVLRIPDNPLRHASGNNIYTTTATLAGKIPVIRYVCAQCGYTENWVEQRAQLQRLKERFGQPHPGQF